MNGSPSRHTCTALFAALYALLGAGCGHAPAPEPRTAPASGAAVPHRGTAPVFVSPSSYEGFIRGELQAARGAHARAIESYRAAIDLGDSDPYLIAKLAEELDRAGLDAEARDLLTRAIDKHPKSEALALASARAYRRHDDAERALSSYARAEELARSSDTALERITYLRELGNHERAVEALYALAKRQEPSHNGSVRDRVRVELELALLGQHRMPVVSCARDWLALGGGDAQLTRRAASAMFAMGYFALALELLAVVPASEDDGQLRLRSAIALGRTAECEHILSSLPPHWLGGPLIMGEAYLAIGLPEQALRILSESTTGNEDASTAAQRTQLIARSLVAAGRANEAAKLIGRAGDARGATCEALLASGLAALARDASCDTTQ
jgi:tetratricopeptide (TPR) repeat protein